MSAVIKILRSTPMCVSFFITIFVVTYHWQTIYEHELDLKFTLCPWEIISKLQIYRLFTSSFLHRSVFHLGINSLAFYSLGTFHELSFGTRWHLSTIFWSVLLVNSLSVLLALFIYLCGITDVMNEHTLGFSNVIFHLIVIECHLNSTSSHLLFGFIKVSSEVYPWVLLITSKLILPKNSFVGHLSGILVGNLHITGLLHSLLPSVQYLRSLDDDSAITSYENYVQAPSSDGIFEDTFCPSPTERKRRFCCTLQLLCKMTRDVAETLLVMIFGRDKDVKAKEEEKEGDTSKIGNPTIIIISSSSGSDETNAV